MDKAQAREQVLQMPLLSAMGDGSRGQAADILLAISEELELAHGDLLMHEGALGGMAGYILLEGAVVVAREGASPITLDAPALVGEMQQFNPQAQRTATVTAKGPGMALKFIWQQLYTQAREQLAEAEQALLIDGIERCVWERFHADAVVDLALFRELPDQLKLRASLLLLWNAHPLSLKEGELLFKEGDQCGAVGYLLLDGAVGLSVAGQVRHVVKAPDLIGLLPDFDPEMVWSATALAQSKAELLKFSWQNFMAMLRQRMPGQAQKQFLAACQQATRYHFGH